MTTFYDDFERPDGALGGAWTGQYLLPTIAAGMAGGPTHCAAANYTVTGDDYLRASGEIHKTVSTSQHAAPAVKMSADATYCYFAYVTWLTGTFTFSLYKKSGSSYSLLATTSWAGPVINYYTIEITYDRGHITATLDGAHTLEANNADLAGNPYGGFATRFVGNNLANITITGETGPSLAVDPALIGNYGGACTTLSFTGTDTTWLSTPPAFTITYGGGTLSDITVIDDTHATALYCPGSYLGAIVFFDPTTGQHADATVTSNPEILPPPGTDNERPTEAGADLLDDKALGVRHSGTVVTNEQPMLTIPVMSYEETVASIWGYIRYIATGLNPPEVGLDKLEQLFRWVSGTALLESWDPTPPTQTTLKQDLAALLAVNPLLATGLYADAGAVVNTLAGDPFASHRTILEAIAAIPPSDLSAVLTRLDEIQGPGMYNLDTIVNNQEELVTAHNWNLENVHEWINGKANEGTLIAGIAELNGMIGAIALELVALTATEAADAAASATAGTSAAGALAWLLLNGPTILDMLNQIKQLLAPADSDILVPPIWPGEPNVVWGEQITIESNQPLLGRMHGVVVEITACEPGTRFFDYDGIRSWGHLGALVFATDRGDVEPFQPLGPQRAIYTPTRMREAMACRLYRSRNVRGTVRPWTIKEA